MGGSPRWPLAEKRGYSQRRLTTLRGFRTRGSGPGNDWCTCDGYVAFGGSEDEPSFDGVRNDWRFVQVKIQEFVGDGTILQVEEHRGMLPYVGALDIKYKT